METFELLVRLRIEEEGLAVRDAVRAVLRDNLFGLEIDPRCTQIAAFNLALAAWRMAGERIELPALNIACCGIAPEGSEADWERLADELEGRTGIADDPDLFSANTSIARGPLQEGMCQLHRLYRRARDLGSLIDPEAVGADLLHSGYDDLETLLDAAIRRERIAGTRNESVVAAAGMARAAEILTGRYTLVVTNVPFLARGKQGTQLYDFAETHHGDAKGDIATVFVSRIFRWLGDHGTQALVTPQNWLFLTTYRKLRERLLKGRTWNVVARLGPGAFETISGEVVNVALVVLSTGKPEPDWEMAGVDVSAPLGQRPIRALEKAVLLSGGAEVVESIQADQLKNPDSAVLIRPVGDGTLLSDLADSFVGIQTGDDNRYCLALWELPRLDQGTWEFVQHTPPIPAEYCGLTGVIRWERGQGPLHLSPGARPTQGSMAVGRDGVAMHRMGMLRAYRFSSQRFHQNVAVVVPHEPNNLHAVWAFCSSPEYAAAVREFDQNLKVTNATLVKVPLDLKHWTKVASERYPNGLSDPYSDDPTQWIFHGDPCRSVVWDDGTKRTEHGPKRFDHTVLQVAVAHLLGYRWPAELDPEMRLDSKQRAIADRCTAYDDLADADGIVCLSPARGEMSAADRLRTLLIRAYGDEWSAATERRLLAATNPNGRAPRSLEDWLRDHFFAEQCKLFHNRPFIWHIWDGREDGFHALVNYHRLAGPDGEGRRTLKSLAYAYLNDWIHRQRVGRDDGTVGADDRLARALDLQEQLERILEGEPPCDLFVRWKPLDAQAIGWEPDLDDGVRLNIRPFMRAELHKGGRGRAGILRWKPNIQWGKDRGIEPQEPRPRDEFPWFYGCPGDGSAMARTNFTASTNARFDGRRWNDLHYTRAAREAARERTRMLGDREAVS